MRGLNLERGLIAAAAAGGCIKIIEVAKKFVQDRQAFGKNLSEFQAVSHKFADMRMAMETARLVTYRTAEMLDAGEDAVTETAIAKVVATESNFKAADLGMQVMGAAGYVQGDMQRLFREARMGMIGGGTSEILRTSSPAAWGFEPTTSRALDAATLATTFILGVFLIRAIIGAILRRRTGLGRGKPQLRAVAEGDRGQIQHSQCRQHEPGIAG